MKFVGFRTKYRILLFIQHFKRLCFFKDVHLEKNKRTVYIFLAADYGNLGDVAITYAQTQFLSKHLPNSQVFEIPISQSLEGLVFVRRNIKPKDLVTIVGGGNMGDMYDQIEFIRQLVLKSFPNNKIISFPQTIDFSDSVNGRKALNVAQKVYNSHRNLVLIAREKISFELMNRYFVKAKILLTPDIVFTLDESKPENPREGVILCLRNDKEKRLTVQDHALIERIAKQKFGKVTTYDTVIDRSRMSLTERNEELQKIWAAFRAAELVITDRLHGMIFCYITKTPCIVFSNSNHKIESTYKWLRGNKHIILVNEMYLELIDVQFNSHVTTDNNSDILNPEFNLLLNLIKE